MATAAPAAQAAAGTADDPNTRAVDTFEEDWLNIPETALQNKALGDFTPYGKVVGINTVTHFLVVVNEENVFSTVSVHKPHILHRLSLTGPPFFLRNEEHDEDLDKANNMSIMEFFKGLEMIQSAELPCIFLRRRHHASSILLHGTSPWPGFSALQARASSQQQACATRSSCACKRKSHR